MSERFTLERTRCAFTVRDRETGQSVYGSTDEGDALRALHITTIECLVPESGGEEGCAALRPAAFVGEWFDILPEKVAPLPGYTTGQTWNGWAMPLLPEESVRRLVEIVRSLERLTFRGQPCLPTDLIGETSFDGHTLTIAGDATQGDEQPSTITPSVYGETHLWDVSLGWCWDEVPVSAPTFIIGQKVVHEYRLTVWGVGLARPAAPFRHYAWMHTQAQAAALAARLNRLGVPLWPRHD